jgi:hypothetical protein
MVMLNLAALDKAVRLVCPIIGLSLSENNIVTVMFKELATEAQRIAAQAVVDNWVDPPEPRLVWALEFLDRFSEATQLAVVSAAQQNPSIRLWYDRLLANGSVDLNNARLIAGLNAMRDAGLMSQAEIDVALA